MTVGAVKFSMACAGADLGFVLNGKAVAVSGIAPQTTLLDYIRGQGLTGAKEGCAEGECGACAVLFVRTGAAGTVYQSVNSCLVPLSAAAGQEVYTVEALAESGELADPQRAMAEGGGSQCGYCTPGFIVSMFAWQQSGLRLESPEAALGGNLCRCTGYRPIRDALQSLGPPRDTPMRRRLQSGAPPVKPMEYASHGSRFSRPCTLSACLKLASEDPAAKFVAGNTDLGVMTNLRHERFPHLISVEGVPELREFEDREDAVEIGAALTLTEIEERWTSPPVVFSEWLRLFASPLIRNRATLGGNLATASPIGDSAPLLLALDAELRICGMKGERVAPLDSFFRGYRQTSLDPGEIIRSIRIPKPLPELVRFYKVAKRRVDDISTVAAAISMGSRGVRLGLGGVGPVPLRAKEAETAMGAGFDIREILRRTLRPMSDHRGSAAYRLAMAASLVEKFFFETGGRR